MDRQGKLPIEIRNVFFSPIMTDHCCIVRFCILPGSIKFWPKQPVAFDIIITSSGFALSVPYLKGPSISC